MACALLVTSPAAAQMQAPYDLPASTVRMVQHSLMQGGYAVDSADGVWGPKTAAALREFQRVKGLTTDRAARRADLAALGVPGSGGAGVSRRPPQVRKRTPRTWEPPCAPSSRRSTGRACRRVRSTASGASAPSAPSATCSGPAECRHPVNWTRIPSPRLASCPSPDRPVARRPGQALGAADLDPAAIRMIQQSLSQRGFLSGTADGVWGENTVAASARPSSRAQGLEPLGEPDVYTLAALGLLPGSAPAPVRPPREQRDGSRRGAAWAIKGVVARELPAAQPPGAET